VRRSMRAAAVAFRSHGTPMIDARAIERAVPEEAAVAFTYDGGSYAVMMATPGDLDDFAVGFSLNEGIVAAADEIEGLEVVEEDIGIELRMWLAGPRAASLRDRRRHVAGPTGCGLCGIETLAEAMRACPRVTTDTSFAPALILRALATLGPAQTLHRETRAVHAAAFFEPTGALMAVREDVGRHNALDKLHGALARAGAGTQAGFVVVTSRVSVEMVQKTAVMGAPLLVAVSAPTALAIRTADAAGITLAAIARDDGFEVFTHPDRIRREEIDVREHVA
jgi:FdhD protein